MNIRNAAPRVDQIEPAGNRRNVAGRKAQPEIAAETRRSAFGNHFAAEVFVKTIEHDPRQSARFLNPGNQRLAVCGQLLVVAGRVEQR